MSQTGKGTLEVSETPNRIEMGARNGSLHGEFVFTGSFVRRERQTPCGGVVQGHADTPQVHAHAVGFLMRLTKHGAFIHVWVLFMEREKMEEKCGSGLFNTLCIRPKLKK